jgi:hypothetical protein
MFRFGEIIKNRIHVWMNTTSMKGMLENKNPSVHSKEKLKKIKKN